MCLPLRHMPTVEGVSSLSHCGREYFHLGLECEGFTQRTTTIRPLLEWSNENSRGYEEFHDTVRRTEAFASTKEVLDEMEEHWKKDP
jgi:hypothetical protein